MQVRPARFLLIEMIVHLCYNYPCLGNIKTAFVAVWKNLQTCYNLLLTPLVRVAVFPRQEPPTLREVFLFGDKMGTIKFIPSNEMETREWFAAHIADFDYSIVKSRGAFPDYILEDGDGKQYGVEIEYASDNFILHRHDPKGCDFVLCWIHTQELPVPVLELSTNTWYLANQLPSNPRPVKRGISSVKTKGIDREKLKLVIPKCKDQAEAFIFAFAVDLEIRREYLNALKEYRLPLLKASDNLVNALNKKGMDIDQIHPYDLFNLVINIYKSKSVGDTRFIKIAMESVKSIDAIFGENTET